VRISAPVFLLLAALAAGTAGFGMYRVFTREPAAGTALAGSEDIRIISRGEPLNLRDHLVPGKYTLFDYYADWCPPCREMAPRLEELARRNPNLAIRKIDIVDWNHPVAEQQDVHDLPYLRLYDPEGRLLLEGEATFDALERLFRFGFPSTVR